MKQDVPEVIGLLWIVPKRNNMGGIAFGVRNKPNWFHRLMMKLILGWEYTEGENT